MSKYWLVQKDPLIASELVISDLRVMNARAVDRARHEFFRALPGRAPWPDPLPDDFPTPILMLPNALHSVRYPDYFSYGGNYFASDKLRAAMSLPSWAASWVKCDVLGKPGSRPRYWFFYPRAVFHAIDIHKSIASVTEEISAKTGEAYLYIQSPKQFRFLDGDSNDAPPIFTESKYTYYGLFATQDLALRVVDAGCTGIQFAHPLWAGAYWTNEVVLGRNGLQRRIFDEDLEKVLSVEHITECEADKGMPLRP